MLSQPLQGAMPAHAEEAAAPKKKSPDALEVVGSKKSKVDGRWSKVFGKKINGRVTYQKDGEALFLVFGDCEKFIMVENKANGDCAKAYAINEKAGWAFKGGEPQASVKVRPISEDGKVEQTKEEEAAADAEADEKKKALDTALYKAKAQMDKEFELAGEFMVMDGEEEDIAGRLLKKFNAKVLGTPQR